MHLDSPEAIEADEMDFKTKSSRFQDPSFTLGVSTKSKASFERLPFELIEKIVITLPRDTDVQNLAETSTYFASAILPSHSGIWRARFLSLYDYPIIEHSNEFRFAYQIRRLTTNAFVGFEHGVGEQGLECLETLKDMIIEAYNAPGKSAHTPIQSKNLNLFAQPSPYIDKFLAHPLCSFQQSKFGQPHDYFDILQLCLSHLMLTPHSYAAIKSSSRENFDAQRVYRFDQKFELIYQSPNVEHSWRFVPIGDPVLSLHVHDLLHIRNFWNRHFASVDENTYIHMADKLCKAGRGPQEWKYALQPTGINFELAAKWIGHYSCLHPPPKQMAELQYGDQTCGEDWDAIEPLTLDVVNSSTQASWFPEIFANVPALKHTLPDLKQYTQKSSRNIASRNAIKYFRGTAPFVSLVTAGKDSLAPANNKMRAPNINKYLHDSPLMPDLSLADLSNPDIAPYQGLRIRGVAYPVDVKDSGKSTSNESVKQLLSLFTRIVFILFKPTDFYLLATAENWKHAQDTKAFLKHGVTPNELDQGGNNVATAVASDQAVHDSTVDDSSAEASSVKRKLTTSRSKKAKKAKLSEEYSPIPDRALVIKQEDAYHHSTQIPLKWDDIDYAYAYEGSILPGGRIQLGRWWRCDPWIARESGLPVPAGLFEPIDEDENEGDDWDEDEVPPSPANAPATSPDPAPLSTADEANTAAPISEDSARADVTNLMASIVATVQSLQEQSFQQAPPMTPTIEQYLSGLVRIGEFPWGMQPLEASEMLAETLKKVLPGIRQAMDNHLPPTCILPLTQWMAHQTDLALHWPHSLEPTYLQEAPIDKMCSAHESLQQHVQKLSQISNSPAGAGNSLVEGSNNDHSTVGNGSGTPNSDANANASANANGNGNEPANGNTDDNTSAKSILEQASKTYPRLKEIWDEDAVPRVERGPFVFWVDGEGK